MNHMALLRLKGHRANLDRYSRLLATQLTETERQYIHRRIAEEHRAIARIKSEHLAESSDVAIDPKTLLAVRGASSGGANSGTNALA